MTASSQPVHPQDILSYKATLTDGIFLVIPGLLAPEAVDSIPADAAAIGRFLSRSDENTDTSASTSDSFESVIARWFNTSADSAADAKQAQLFSAAARMGYRMEIAPDATPTEVLCVDPVYQQMDINHATLADQSLLNLTVAESNEIIATLNQQFESDGLRFESDHPLRWYCVFDQVMDIRAVSLSAATGRDVSLCRPTGDDARRWRTLLAEIEMILYSHPVNQRRDARGDLPVNSLWLWGDGALPLKSRNTGAIYTNNFYTKSYASHSGMPVQGISDFSCDNQPALVVDDRLASAAATADAVLRKQVVDELNHTVFAPLDQSRGVIKSGGRVSLWCGGSRFWQLPERIDIRHWITELWKPSSFEHYIESRTGDPDNPDTGKRNLAESHER